MNILDDANTAVTKVAPLPAYLLDWSADEVTGPAVAVSDEMVRRYGFDKGDAKETYTSAEALAEETAAHLSEEELSIIIAQCADHICFSLMRGARQNIVDLHHRSLLRVCKNEQINRRNAK